MGTLIKILLFGMIFYYIMKTVGGFIFRIMGGRVQQNQNRYTQKQPARKEGEIIIDSAPSDKGKRKGAAANDGDYIDFEEIK
jgi:hypothetical protein